MALFKGGFFSESAIRFSDRLEGKTGAGPFFKGLISYNNIVLDDYIMIYERNKASEDTYEVYSLKNILEIYFHIHKLLFKVSDSNGSMPLQLAGE